MKTKTIRTIAEMNMGPLVRVSSMSIAAYVLMALTAVFHTSDVSILMLIASALLFDRHVRWCDRRHRKEAE